MAEISADGACGGGDSEPVPSSEQLVGDGKDIEVLESSSNEDNPGDSKEPCCELPC